MTLTDFVLARIAEREAVAQAATPGPWRSEPNYEDAGTIYTDAPLDSLPLKDETWSEDRQRSIASESAWGDIWIQDAAHIALNDPAAVLADCEAKRRIIAVELATNQNRSELGGLDDDAFRAIEWVLRVLALPYADHPDYDEDWKP